VQNATSSDLGRLFGAALQAMEANQQAVNDLDGYNGNHGDNMVQNLRTITAALSAREQAPPSEALRYASRELAARGKGGTSQYYVNGLDQAAERLQGRSELSRGDVMTLVQSLLGAVPSQGDPQQTDAGGSVFDQVLGLAGSQLSQGGGGVPGSPLEGFLGAQPSQGGEGMSNSPLEGFLGAQQSQGGQGSLGAALGALLDAQPPQDNENPASSQFQGFPDAQQAQGGQGALGGMLGALLGGETSQGGGNAPDSPLAAFLGSEQPQGGENMLGGVLGALLGGQQSQPGQQGQDRAGNLIRALLPAALAFLQAKQSGAEMPAALEQALMSFLASRQMDPLQAGTPRSAAGGLVAQSMLRALGD
jgi:hypothetical protein